MNLATFLASTAAVADPTRLRMLVALDAGPFCVGQLAASVGVTSAAVTYHVKLLRRAGLVGVQRVGRRSVVRRVERRWAAIVRAFAGDL